MPLFTKKKNIQIISPATAPKTIDKRKNIDKLLADHYGFTDEELDFIINYDVKYRMGEELNEEYILPKAFDPRVGESVAKAVAKAARDSGVARK